MVFQNNLIAGASAAGTAAFDTTLIGNSIWLEGSGTSGDSMTRSFGTPTNSDRWIWATWYCPLREADSTGDRGAIFASGSSSLGFTLQHHSNNSIFHVFHRDEDGTEGTINTAESYRDLGRWLHLLVDYDSANSTANDRIALYVNGVKTGVLGGSRPGSGKHINVNVSGQTHRIGQDQSGTPDYHSQCYLAQTVFLDNHSIANSDVSISSFLDTFSYGTNGSQLGPKSNAEILLLANAAGDQSFLLDFEKANPVNIAAGVTPTDVSSAGTHSGSLGNLTDGDHSTEWRTNVDPATDVSNHTVGFDLGSAKEVNTIKITGRGSTTGNYKVQHSDDNSSFTDTGTTFSSIATTTTTGSGVLDFTSDSAGSHRYWRLVNISNASGSSGWGYREIVFHTSANGLGTDTSSNNNHWTSTSVSLTNQSSNTPSNVYPLINTTTFTGSTSTTISEGATKAALPDGGGIVITQPLPFSGGVYYFEIDVTTMGSPYVGIGDQTVVGANHASPWGQAIYDKWYFAMSHPANSGGPWSDDGTLESYAGGAASGATRYGVAWDADNRALYFGTISSTTITWLNSGDPTSGSSKTGAAPGGWSLTNDDTLYLIAWDGGSNTTLQYLFESGDWTGATNRPSDALDLSSAKLTAPSNQGIDYFKSATYAGNGTAIAGGGKAITGTNFQPDFVWIKNRDQDGDSHSWYDAVRGTTKQIESDTATVQSTESEGLTTFGSDGFTVGNLNQVNTSSENFVAWQWKAQNGTTSVSADGPPSLASTVSVAKADHFSIVSYTGNTGSAQTIGHGLSGAAQMIITHNLDQSGANWAVYHEAAGATKYMLFNGSSNPAAGSNTNYWNDTAPTTSSPFVFSVGNGTPDTNGNSQAMIAYCFRSIAGVCKVGWYIPNNLANGPYVALGFKPTFLLIKNSSSAGNNWVLYDTSRDTVNPATKILMPNLGDDELDGSGNRDIDILSDGFHLRENDAEMNGGTSDKYIYLAMADIGGNGTLPPIYGI